MNARTRVLIIDDDPDYRELLELEMSVTSDAYEVDSVGTFAEGLAQLEASQHDIYLVDYDLDGNHTADLLIETAVQLMRPIILITSHADHRLGDQAIEVGASDFVVKRHVSAALLDRLIRNSLARHQKQSQLVQRQQQLTQMVTYDALTGLISRAMLKEIVREKMSAEPGQGAMLYIDLDGFKQVNDQHGHATGDELLQTMAGRMSGCVRSHDIIGRLGGDEFLVFMPGDAEMLPLSIAAAIVAGDLVDMISRPYLLRTPNKFGATVSLSASVGIALAPEHDTSYEGLRRRADQAMYRAKREKNRFCFYRNNLTTLNIRDDRRPAGLASPDSQY